MGFRKSPIKSLLDIFQTQKLKYVDAMKWNKEKYII